MSLRVLADRVLVKPDPPDKESELLEVVHDYDVPAMSGTIIGFGRGGRCKRCHGPLWDDLNVGDRVCFGPRVGSEVDYDGETYLALRQDDILGVIED